MAQNTSKLPCKPNKTETDRVLDLSSIIEKLDTYSKGEQINSHTWHLDDLLCSIICYPQGTPNSNANDISIYLKVARVGGVAKNDCRKIQFSLKSGNIAYSFVYPIHQFAPGRGWPNAISHFNIKQNPIIHINIKLNHDPLFIQKIPSQTLEQQLEKMHKISALEGDVTLVVKLNQDNICEPPVKKRKLNEFQCEVCDKQFDGNKALKSHQSNKRDQAHKIYKKNHNKNNNLEIKISSVILRSASTVFDRILRANMREKQEKKIVFVAKSVEDVSDLTYFMSTNKLKSDCNALNMIELAHYYEMDRLFWQSVNKSIKDISIDNFANTINIFDKYQITKGYGVLVEFAKKNTEKLKNTDDFDKIPHSFKCIALNIDET